MPSNTVIVMNNNDIPFDKEVAFGLVIIVAFIGLLCYGSYELGYNHGYDAGGKDTLIQRINQIVITEHDSTTFARRGWAD